MRLPVFPDSQGRFGPYGGRYVPETLMPALLELESAYAKVRRDRRFQQELASYLKQYVGRPTSLYRADRLSKPARTRSTTRSGRCSSLPG
jgi:tryptophan synthase beta chain